jgi:prolyl-tRNA editing enzyme YbaK/EbsC (Cys-tRNA(Pro) deacylase)
MIKHDDVETLIGHPVGGVCPFGIKPGVDVFLDTSLKRFDTVFPACGTGNSAIELTLPELETYSHSIDWVDVSKGWQ